VVDRAGVRYTIYPSLEDRGEGVAIVECATAEQAMQRLRFGVLRLLMLSLPQQYKYVRQQVTSNRELSLLAQGVQLEKPLADAVAERIFQECFLMEGVTLPRSTAAFEQILNQGRTNLDKNMNRVMASIAVLFKELRKARQLINELQSPAFVTAISDIGTQMQLLFSPEFLRITPTVWFSHLPRYAQAMVRRLERLRGNAGRDAELARQIAPFVSAHKKLDSAHSSVEIEQLKWMIEEFRVSLFAQDLKTAIPVSAKRLNEQVALAEKAL
ncbi:MAG: DUF3418 domain-containing protein, partial [Steroidobacter sp.]